MTRERMFKKMGFTLIEILLTLTIVSLLTLVGYPLYQQHCIKTYRNTAKIALLNTATQLEQFYLQQHTYENEGQTNPGETNMLLHQHYKFEIDADVNSYTLSAIALGQQAKQDTQCGNLILKHTGEKQITGSGTILSCW